MPVQGDRVFARVRSLTKETDGGIWIPAKLASFYTGTWTDTRVAAGDYGMRKTAAANAGQAVFHLSDALLTKIGSDTLTGSYALGGTHDIRGFRLTAIDVVYQIGTDVLNTHTAALNQRTFANNVANAVAAFGGSLTGTLATAVQTNPYVTQITLGTPAIIGGNAADKDVTLELAWDAAATCVLTYYGIYLRTDYNLL